MFSKPQSSPSRTVIHPADRATHLSGELAHWVERQLWHANFKAPPLNDEEFFSHWGLAQRELEAFDSARPEIALFITTFNRAGSCERLLRQLFESIGRSELLADQRAHVTVLNDHSIQNYESVEKELGALFRGRSHYLFGAHRLGKQGYWRTYHTAFRLLARVKPKYALFLQDDVQIGPRFMDDALGTWLRIADRRKRALHLFECNDDEPSGRWVHFRRREIAEPAVRLTQWLDLSAVLLPESTLRFLRYEVTPISESRWLHDSARSSGVGEQLTRRLAPAGGIYQVRESLVTHGTEPSLMNPEARRATPLVQSRLRGTPRTEAR